MDDELDYDWDFYFFSGQPSSKAVLIVLEIIKDQINLVRRINYRYINDQWRDKYYAVVDPSRSRETLIPTLVDGDFVLPGSHAILKYLDDKYSPNYTEYSRNQKPTEQERAKINQWLYQDQDILNKMDAYLRLIVKYKKNNTLPDENHEIIKEIKDVLMNLDSYMANRSYLATDELTIADISLLCTLDYGEYGLEHINSVHLNNFKNITDWMNRCTKWVLKKPWLSVNQFIAFCDSWNICII